MLLDNSNTSNLKPTQEHSRSLAVMPRSRHACRLSGLHHGCVAAFAGVLLVSAPGAYAEANPPSATSAARPDSPSQGSSRPARLAQLDARRAHWRTRVAIARQHLEAWYQRRLVRITEIRNIASARQDQDALGRLARLEAKLEELHQQRTELIDRAARRIDD